MAGIVWPSLLPTGTSGSTGISVPSAATAGAPTDSSAELLRHVIRRGRAAGQLQPGDRIVLLTGSDVTGKTHNMIQVHEVE